MAIKIGTLTKAAARAAKARDDRAFLLIAIALELALQNRLDAATNDIIRAVNKYSRGDKLQDSTSAKTDIVAILAAYLAEMDSSITKAVKDVAQAKVDIANQTVGNKLQKMGGFKFAQQLRQDTRGYAEDKAKRFRFDKKFGETYDGRIKTIRAGTEKTVRNIVDNGVKQGLSARGIAQRLEQYVNPVPGTPKARPFDIYRQRFGSPKSFVPKGVPAGTVQYNAIRIARTETAHTYRNSTRDFYKGKVYVRAFRWTLSNSHKKVDICDYYASRTWQENEIPSSHPFCLCDVEPDLYSDNTLQKIVDLSAKGYTDSKIKEALSL